MITNFKTWIKCALIRSMKTFAQTFLSVIGCGAAVLGDVNWAMVISSATLAAIRSIATSVAGLPEAKTDATSTNEVPNDE